MFLAFDWKKVQTRMTTPIKVKLKKSGKQTNTVKIRVKILQNIFLLCYQKMRNQKLNMDLLTIFKL